jgi:hypothetical protein
MLSVIGKIKFGKDILKSCEYSVGGGMLGGCERIVLRREGDGAVLIHSMKETHADKEIICEYKKGAETLDRAARIALDYNLYGASRRPRSRIEILDGDTSHVEFTFTKGEFSVSDRLVLSRHMKKGFSEFRNYLYSLASEESET